MLLLTETNEALLLLTETKRKVIARVSRLSMCRCNSRIKVSDRVVDGRLSDNRAIISDIADDETSATEVAMPDTEEGRCTYAKCWLNLSYFIMLDPGDFFATKSLKLLGSGVFEKKKEFDKKKLCLILSFGDYYRN